MSSRLRNVAAQNQSIAEAGGYRAEDGTEVRIAEALAAAVAGTRCVAPDAVLPAPRGGAEAGACTAFEVTAEGSLQAARRLVASAAAAGGRDGGGGRDGRGGGRRDGSVAVLNFASARNVGGGYLGGARAQEEDLCRQSLLHPCLLTAPEYYDAHRASDDLLYSDRLIWSPAVPVHRGERGELLAQPCAVSFLTCPAPNAGALLRRDGRDPEARARILSRIGETLTRRAGRVLGVAAGEGVRDLVLGAWGCGVFRNDPREVAEAFRAWLRPGAAFADTFDRVVFAVWDRAEPSPNRAAFAEVFAGLGATSE
ncbi:TIGR02452 family protein [Streptacidiphilus fuscans]|uniref:TIGR02452 family protein n=1 Tax=Streptacidiphilus fuscans TaxID=2789292 RepID=A0A931B494_9ACTN|nr:TIGR02452 family protein [Streptacidiphilus fuscans]MBF9070033.1 TIGR02452 family protein [Streptacidiphilus fuscans]